MTDLSPVLVLTRPEAQSHSFLSECRASFNGRIEAIVSPILTIQPVEFEVDLDNYKTVIITSQNALLQIGRNLRGKRVVTVGNRTAIAASAFGADAKCLGGSVEAFLENTNSIDEPALHVRGVHTRGDLAKQLGGRGLTVEETIVYDQAPTELSKNAQDALLGGRAIVPVFSPRSAELVSTYACHEKTRVLAISAPAAKAWRGRALLKVASEPTKDAMRDLVLQAL